MAKVDKPNQNKKIVLQEGVTFEDVIKISVKKPKVKPVKAKK